MSRSLSRWWIFVTFAEGRMRLGQSSKINFHDCLSTVTTFAEDRMHLGQSLKVNFHDRLSAFTTFVGIRNE